VRDGGEHLSSERESVRGVASAETAHNDDRGSNDVEFWSDEYRGRPIAILNRHGRLHVYLDHVLQQDMVFDSGQNALAWLMRRIEQGVPARVN
jgi:hypothetical protein